MAKVQTLEASTEILELCLTLIEVTERTQGIPPGLLRAVAETESGRKVSGRFCPWPWTVNTCGKAYVFRTKSAAVQFVKSLKRKGVCNIDVGCMQVNLGHHPKAFSSLEEAFNPRQNIAYAGKFLKRKYKAHGEWDKAVAHYHSSKPAFYRPYCQKVFKRWYASLKRTEPCVSGLSTEVFVEEQEALLTRYRFYPAARRIHF